MVTLTEPATGVEQTPDRGGAERGDWGSITPEVLERLKEGIPLAGDETGTTAVEVPFTGEELGRVLRCTAASVRKAVARARNEQKTWAERSFGERAAVFVRLHDLILDQQDQITPSKRWRMSPWWLATMPTTARGTSDPSGGEGSYRG
jgi:hypothetical protein